MTWVPQTDDQVQPPQLISPTPLYSLGQIGSVIGAKEFPKADTSNGSFKWRDYGCTVPETCAPFSKTSRHFR